MKVLRVSLNTTALLFAAGLTAACGGGSQPAPAPAEKIQPQEVGEMSPEEAGGMGAESSTLTEPGHAAAPHGGTVVALGTAGSLEFVHDPSTGTLTAYVLDGTGKVTRIPAKAISVSVSPAGGAATAVSLSSTANGLTGDTVGNSSQFTGTSAALKGVTAFAGTVTEAAVGGETFKDVTFNYAAAH